MTAVREKWTEMSWFRRILLLWMAAMILGFGIAMPVVRAAQGIEYGDDFLRLRQEGEVRYYEGEVDWEDAAFTVWHLRPLSGVGGARRRAGGIWIRHDRP